MGEGITRRDFLDGVACAIVAGATPPTGYGQEHCSQPSKPCGVKIDRLEWT
jgi:hypothetical protein